MFYDNGLSDDNLCENGRTTVVIWHCGQDFQDVKMTAQQLDTCKFQVDVFANDIC